MIDLFLAASLLFFQSRPTNWQAAMGVVQDVRQVHYPNGQTFVQLVMAGGRTVEIGQTIIWGPQAPPDYYPACDQMFTPKDLEP